MKIAQFLGFLMISMVLTMSEGMAQYKKRPNDLDKYLKTQWWLGLRLGGSLTAAAPEELYSGFSPINYPASESEKSYDDYAALNGLAGIEITFYHQGFSFSLQPNYRRNKFTYRNSYAWTETINPDNSLELQYDQDHLIDYIEIPIFIKYDLLPGKIRPFIQVGAYYGFVVGANKSLKVSGTDSASGTIGPFETRTSTVGAKELFIKSSTGIAGGVGLSYDLWNVRLVFDAVYRYGLNNVTNVQHRFSANQLASIGDALDDMKLRNISFSIGCAFPLRFISKNHQSVN